MFLKIEMMLNLTNNSLTNVFKQLNKTSISITTNINRIQYLFRNDVTAENTNKLLEVLGKIYDMIYFTYLDFE